MNKFIVLLLIGLLALSGTVFAADVSQDAKESKHGSLSATATAAAAYFDKAHVIIVNEGSNEAFLRLNSTVVATTSDFHLRANRSVTLDATPGSKVNKVGYVCSAGETTTLDYLAWD